MIVPSPVHEAKIRTLTDERTHLLRAIDVLLEMQQCEACDEQRSTPKQDVLNMLKPFDVSALLDMCSLVHALVSRQFLMFSLYGMDLKRM